jgi:hypothetical protein
VPKCLKTLEPNLNPRNETASMLDRFLFKSNNGKKIKRIDAPQAIGRLPKPLTKNDKVFLFSCQYHRFLQGMYNRIGRQ